MRLGQGRRMLALWLSIEGLTPELTDGVAVRLNELGDTDMSWRGEVEDGVGWGGLVASKSERREEARQDQLEKDAQRYRKLRRGQHWSVINGIGDELRGEALDLAVDAAPPLTAND